MAEVKTIKINVDTKGAVSSMDNLTKATGGTNAGMKNASSSTGQMGRSISSLSPAFGGAISGAQGLLKVMWALVANPIGAIIAAVVLAVTALYKAFASTKAGGEKVEQVMAGIGAVMDVLRDRVLKIGSAIAKFMTGDFSGAFKDAKAGFSGMGDEMQREFTQAARASRMLQEVEDNVRRLGVSRAKLNRDLAKTKEIITDENATLAQKTDALNKVRIAEEKQTNSELANARKKLAAIRKANKLSDTSKEDLQKASDAQSALYQLEQTSAENTRALNKQEKTIKSQARADEKARNADGLAARKEQNDKANADRKEQIKIEKDLEEKRTKDLTAITEAYGLRSQTLNQQAVIARLKQYDKEKEAAGTNADLLVKLEEEFDNDIRAINKKFDTDSETTNKQNIKLSLETKLIGLKGNFEAEQIVKKQIASQELEILLLNEKLSAEAVAKLKAEAKAKIEAIDLATEQKAKEISNLKNITNATEQQLELIALDELYAKKFELAKDNEELTTELTKEENLKRAAIEKKYSDIKQDRAIQNVKNTLETISNISELFAGKDERSRRKAFNIQKAAGIASAVIDTYVSTRKAFTTQLIPGDPTSVVRAGLAAAVALTAGLLNVKKIASTQFDSRSVDSSKAPEPNGVASAPPNFNVVGNTGINQLNNLNQPIQAFVVSGEMTSQQQLDRNKQSLVTL